MVPSENKLLSLLSNNDVTFFIPPYQRNYEWDTEQCKVFFDDIVKTSESNMNGDASEHFFGSVTYFQTEVVFGQPNKLVLIDGQQRITTTMLFLVALRDVIEDENIKNKIDNSYLKNNNVSGDSEYKIKLKQVETDWKAYRNIILSIQLSDKDKLSAVYKNYTYFYGKLESIKKEKPELLTTFLEKGLFRFSVITIQLEPDKNKWENPQEIFESMNSLGKPLSFADLVRNYILLGMEPDTQDTLYTKYWLHIEETLPRKVSDFIRDYMQCKESKPYPKATDVNCKKLYACFKQSFSETDSEELLKDIDGYSTVYSYIALGESSGNKKLDRHLNDIRTIGVTTCYSFLMSLLYEWKKGGFSDDEIDEIMSAFNVFVIRRRIAGLSGNENHIFPELSKTISRLKDAKEKATTMFDILSEHESSFRLPNDIEMSRLLETMNFYNFKYCKFVLALVEEVITKSRPALDDEFLQIEHIMPQRLNEEWQEYLGQEAEEIHQELVHNIGNLTLIRHNQELGQKIFSDKIDLYENKAGLQISKTEIINREKWDKESIENRGKWLIDIILDKVLPIPENRKKINNYNIKESSGLSFQELQLIGLELTFAGDDSIVVKVVNDKEVEFEGKKWRLSPLTREIQTRKGNVNASGSYSGAQWWEYEGIRLADIVYH